MLPKVNVESIASLTHPFDPYATRNVGVGRRPPQAGPTVPYGFNVGVYGGQNVYQWPTEAGTAYLVPREKSFNWSNWNYSKPTANTGLGKSYDLYLGIPGSAAVYNMSGGTTPR
jgi:hypothetical protein